MADWRAALLGRITADAGVASLAGPRVHWAIVPEKSALPYVRLQTISDVRPEHLKGYDEARVTRVQADCFAAGHKGVVALAEAVIAALALPTTHAGVRFGRIKAMGPDGGGEDVPGGFVHRARVDLLVEHSDA